MDGWMDGDVVIRSESVCNEETGKNADSVRLERRRRRRRRNEWRSDGEV